ncbi:MAG: pancreas/duodenum homeobox protein 1 [Desulfobulbaceae bacterium]|nr:pancreas/duodenum homeobox protein 1 [Desulfobulbaceae bacterium]HIJ78757.1 pancreas/duodenum homeobox protein 1 [Deltaproteobacteria bacterium]
MDDYGKIFTEDALGKLFPPTRADEFFDALFGDANEGAYDIKLAYRGKAANQLNFELELHERPGRCLVCNLTYGLPEVFSRHPIINIKGLAGEIVSLLGIKADCADWKLGSTNSISKSLHAIPLRITLK